MAYYDELRAKIADICFDLGDSEMFVCEGMADRILRLPEIAIPLANAMPDMTSKEVRDALASIRVKLVPAKSSIAAD